MLATSINEAENEIMWRVEQAYEPARPNLWGSAHVAWTKNFASVQDPNERINSLVDRTMPGGKVPASVETMRSIITEWYDRHGFDVSDEGQQEELLELIRTAQDRESQQDALFRRLRGDLGFRLFDHFSIRASVMARPCSGRCRRILDTIRARLDGQVNEHNAQCSRGGAQCGIGDPSCGISLVLVPGFCPQCIFDRSF